MMELNFNLNLTESKENKLKSPSTEETYDVAVIGAGPAGITATIYAVRKGLRVLLLTKDIGGQILMTYGIENYTGYRFIKAKTLVDKFFEHIKEFEIAFKDSVEVTEIKKEGNYFFVKANDGNTYKSKTVIIATGKSYRKLGVKGEIEFTGKGVAYCATCDAPLFKDKVVAVVGGGNSGLEAALQLAQIAKHVYLLQNLDILTADKILIDKFNKFENKDIFLNSKVLEISGKEKVEKIKIAVGDEEKEIQCDGVFIEIGLIPNSKIAENLVKLNEYKEIVVDCACRTSVEGIFAAGDVTTVPEKQIIVAAGEGAKAALSAYRYVTEKKY